MWWHGGTVYNPFRGFFPAGDPVGLVLTAIFFDGQAYPNYRRRCTAEVDTVRK